MTDKVNIDFSTSGTPNSGGFATSAVSASAALPLQTELLCVQATVPTYIRIGVGAQTAITTTDVLILPGSPLFIIRLNPDLAYTIAAVSPTAGFVNFVRAYEA